LVIGACYKRDVDELEDHSAVHGHAHEGIHSSVGLDLFQQSRAAEEAMRSMQEPPLSSSMLFQRSLSLGSTDNVCACTTCHQVGELRLLILLWSGLWLAWWNISVVIYVSVIGLSFLAR